MKTLYFDCGMGAAGDMLCAALSELIDKDEADAIIEKVNSFGLKGLTVKREKSLKCGISGSHMSVKIDGIEEESLDTHDHGHEHGHDHEGHHDHGEEHDHGGHKHTTLREVRDIIEGLPVTGNVKKEAIEIYELIANAEAKAHDRDAAIIHFHEVGNMDAICDVVLFCMLMERIAPDDILASPLCTGYGHVKCAHGIVPVPAPATAYLLEGIPNYEGEIEGELLTPTGAAILKHFVREYKRRPDMSIDKTGYGMGKKDFEKANCVRAFLGEETGGMVLLGDEGGISGAQICVLECNIDDMTGEELGFAIERLLAAGALEAFAIPIVMKKSRPGHLFKVLCRPEKKQEIIRDIFRYTETIGIRESLMNRYELKREIDTAITDDGEIRSKRATGYGVERVKIEYEDAAALAIKKGISLREAREILEKNRT